eukprot:scaffold17205_cov186-Amphora_coffeaeformis.AAC.14
MSIIQGWLAFFCFDQCIHDPTGQRSVIQASFFFGHASMTTIDGSHACIFRGTSQQDIDHVGKMQMMLGLFFAHLTTGFAGLGEPQFLGGRLQPTLVFARRVRFHVGNARRSALLVAAVIARHGRRPLQGILTTIHFVLQRSARENGQQSQAVVVVAAVVGFVRFTPRFVDDGWFFESIKMDKIWDVFTMFLNATETQTTTPFTPQTYFGLDDDERENHKRGPNRNLKDATTKPREPQNPAR